MSAEAISTIRIRHELLKSPIYIEDLPSATYMSVDGCSDAITNTMRGVFSRMTGKVFEKPDTTCVNTTEFFELMNDTMNIEFTSAATRNQYNHEVKEMSSIIDDIEYAVNNAIPSNDCIESMPSQITNPNRLIEIMVDMIVHALRTLKFKGRKGEPETIEISI